MKNFFAAISLVVGVVTSAAMSACVLYVDDSGSSPSSGSNSYCDSSGCYTCDTAGTCKCVDDSCTSTGSGSGSAFSCTTDSHYGLGLQRRPDVRRLAQHLQSNRLSSHGLPVGQRLRIGRNL